MRMHMLARVGGAKSFQADQFKNSKAKSDPKHAYVRTSTTEFMKKMKKALKKTIKKAKAAHQEEDKQGLPLAS